MAQGIDTGLDFTPCERGLSSKIFSQIIPGAAALALSALFGVWILYLRPAAPNAVEAPAAAPAVALASVRPSIFLGFDAGLACAKLSTCIEP
jgi:hypothetical protein